MVSLGSINNALVTNKPELTAALASLSFDFSLVKVEPPAEFSSLRSALSPKRLKHAEDGSSHITARKLSALFGPVLTGVSIDRLIQCYGSRVSEIAESKSINPRTSQHEGPFSKYIGADGTSIWAAATSGPSAIAVHLLACMLARIFTSSEATSIWEEIVDQRRKEINATLDEDNFGNNLVASIALTRQQLAEWDNSARAWLPRADEAFQKSQKQLKLIIDNLELPVNGKMGTYTSVMDAWRTALNGMEQLLQGKPQNTCEGSLLLGLQSWHIYPNLITQGDKHVDFKDALVPRQGSLTIGLEISPSMLSDEPRGVWWCLPLSRLRYYGDPVVANRSSEKDGSSLTVLQFRYVALGATISDWIRRGSEISLACEIIVMIGKYLKGLNRPHTEPGLIGSNTHRKMSRNWLDALRHAARSFLDSGASEDDLALKAINLGRGRCKALLPTLLNERPPQVFGLGTTLKSCLISDVERAGAKFTDDGSLESIKRYLRSSLVDHRKMRAHFRSLFLKYPGYFVSLTAVSHVQEIYNDLDGALLHPNALSMPLSKRKWTRGQDTGAGGPLPQHYVSREQVLSCIALFETGVLDLNPDLMDNVMAISSGDSIIASASLVSDPLTAPNEAYFLRLVGNIGKPGLSLLVPPPHPKILKSDSTNWKFISHETYSGEAEDKLGGTTLHLSFTDWTMPLDPGGQGRGMRTAEVHYVESLVSVYDRGRWVADLDIIPGLRRGNDFKPRAILKPNITLFRPGQCKHMLEKGQTSEHSVEQPSSMDFDVVKLENWDEFLDRPETPAVVMAKGNQQARLAAAVLGVTQKSHVFAYGRVCWECLENLYMVEGEEVARRCLFII